MDRLEIFRPTLLSIGVMALATLCVGCGGMVRSANPLSEGASGLQACQSQFGLYYLPRAFLKVSIPPIATGSDVKPTIELEYHEDPQAGYCLDYLASWTSDDGLLVQRASVPGLLAKIQSNAVDRTPDIAQKLINVGANLAIASARSFKEGGEGDSIELHFDPFKPDELRRANRGLRRFGYCLYLEGLSFDPSRLSGSGWCARNEFPDYESRLAVAARSPVPAEASQQGVLYRVPISHNVVLMRNGTSNLNAATSWALFQTKRVEMPNLSPVFSIGVDRALFTSRATTLSFDNGMLTDVQIDKKSELVGFVSIPLTLASAIVDVPAQIIQVRIDDTNNRAALIQANDQLIQSLNTLKTDTAAPGLSRSLRSAGGSAVANYAACVDAHGPEAYCRTLLNGVPQ